ncbi:hypothetical protein FLO80_16735 [Aquicoccus porphyridii]|uniref:TadE-like domain-containing protein n=1 Tax=Aquicoccus porphyridii TaxID=1852029 RepID=A0A5A9Z538_9RHOB|nr:hypothetical protein FLO80_16735 [Aquicoccus porphyridii]RAI52897.1 hypothetical protein DOO74_15535 [Rhodobacteraceae bacterium AsT-22]
MNRSEACNDYVRVGLRRVRKLLRDERGLVTIEFVILFPVFVFFLLFILATSLYIGTASDLQQAVQTLARQSVGIIAKGDPDVDICAELNTTILSQVIEQSPLLRLDNVSFPMTCGGQPAEDGSVSLEMSYNLTGSALQSVSQTLGMDFGTISRSAVVFVN